MNNCSSGTRIHTYSVLTYGKSDYLRIVVIPLEQLFILKHTIYIYVTNILFTRIRVNSHASMRNYIDTVYKYYTIIHIIIIIIIK